MAGIDARRPFATFATVLESYATRSMTHDFDSVNSMLGILTAQRPLPGGFTHGLPLLSSPRRTSTP